MPEEIDVNRSIEVDKGKDNVESQAIQSQPSVGSKKEKKGVLGWLLFLCLYLTVFRGLFLTTMALFAIPSSALRAYIILYGLDFGFSLSAGVLLWRKASDAVTYAKIYFILQPYIVLGIAFLLSQVASSGVVQTPSLAVMPAVNSIIWFCYLTFSRRVKHTYEMDWGKRSPVIAFAIGAVLGPLGTIYLHIRVFLMAVLGSTVAISIAVLSSYLFGVSLPPWLKWVWLGFYPIANLILAIRWNDAYEFAEPDDTQWTNAVTFGVGLGIWIFRVVGISTAISLAIALFGQHRIIFGILMLAIFPWAMALPARWIMRIVVIIVALISARSESRRNKSS